MYIIETPAQRTGVSVLYHLHKIFLVEYIYFVIL